MNELMAQQQQMLNQAMQNAQHMQMAYAAIALGLLLVHCLVVYAFYARLSSIEAEIRRFRIAYEFADNRQSQLHNRQSDSGTPNPFATSR